MHTTAMKAKILAAAALVVLFAKQPTYSKQPEVERPQGIYGLDYIEMCNTVNQDALYDADTFCYWYFLSSTSSTTPVSPAVRPSGNNRAFVLIEAMEYAVGLTRLVVKVPAGFVTDYASIPPKLWSLYSPHDQYSRAAIVHDYLYWSQLCTRLQADNLFMIAMKESDVPAATRLAVYGAVRLRGEASWLENGNERRAKLPKVVPLDRKDFPPNWTWKTYREYLVKKNVKDPAFVGNDYCVLGDSTEVPTSLPRTNPVQIGPKVVERERR